MNYQKFRIIKSYDPYVLTLYQVPATIFLGILGVAITYIPKTYDRSDLLYNFLRFESGYQNLEFAMGILFMINAGIFTMLSGKEYLKRIDKIWPILKHLKPSH